MECINWGLWLYPILVEFSAICWCLYWLSSKDDKQSIKPERGCSSRSDGNGTVWTTRGYGGGGDSGDGGGGDSGGGCGGGGDGGGEEYGGGGDGG